MKEGEEIQSEPTRRMLVSFNGSDCVDVGECTLFTLSSVYVRTYVYNT